MKSNPNLFNTHFRILCIFISLNSCSSNPTNADRTTLQKLNGASYESTNSMGIVTELPLLRKITGQAYCGKSFTQIPAKLAEVKLAENSQTIQTTTSDQSGRYDLSAKVSKNKSYSLEIKAKCGSYKTKIEWENDYLKMHEILLVK